MVEARHVNRAAAQLFSLEGRREAPDIVNFEDLKPFWRTLRSEILNDLDNSSWGPGYVEIVEHPKNPLSVRPIARFSIKDRLIYDALAAVVAESIEPLLSDRVYSYRANRPTTHSIRAWVKMRARATAKLQQAGIRMARTDITSFYEHIDLDILWMDLDSIGVDAKTIERLKYFLNHFSHQSHAWGLPQGATASGILANTYLLPIDEWLLQTGIDWVRYSDDIYLFDKNEEELRSILLGTNRTLRARKLSMSSAKTEIFTKKGAKDFLDDTEKDLISYFLGLGKPWAKKLLRDLFARALTQESLNERDIKFSLPRLGRIRDDSALVWGMENLKPLHHLSEQILRYAEALPRHSKMLTQTLEELTNSIPNGDYPYLERNIFHSALRKDLESSAIKSYAWRVLRDHNRPNLPREFAARYIGRFAKPADGPLLRMEYENEGNEHVRRSLLVAMHESDYISPTLLNNLTRSPSQLRWTAAYLLRNPRIPHPK